MEEMQLLPHTSKKYFRTCSDSLNPAKRRHCKRLVAAGRGEARTPAETSGSFVNDGPMSHIGRKSSAKLSQCNETYGEVGAGWCRNITVNNKRE